MSHCPKVELIILWHNGAIRSTNFGKYETRKTSLLLGLFWGGRESRQAYHGGEIFIVDAEAEGGSGSSPPGRRVISYVIVVVGGFFCTVQDGLGWGPLCKKMVFQSVEVP